MTAAEQKVMQHVATHRNYISRLDGTGASITTIKKLAAKGLLEIMYYEPQLGIWGARAV